MKSVEDEIKLTDAIQDGIMTWKYTFSITESFSKGNPPVTGGFPWGFGHITRIDFNNAALNENITFLR